MPHTHGASSSVSMDYGSFGNASPLNSILGGASTSASVASSPDIEGGRYYSGGGGGYQGQAAHGHGGSGPGSVLLFGLSANPPTGRGGHAGIVSFLQAQGQWDEIWVMPVYKHMHAKNALLVDFEDRFQMCRLNFLPLDPFHHSQPHHRHRRKQNGSSSISSGQHLYTPVPATAGGAIGSSSLGPHVARTRVKIMRLEKEVADYHLRHAAQRGQGPETVKVGTIDVVLYAKEHWPGTSFALTLGTDTFNDIKKGKWKRGRELLELVSVVVVSRPGVPYAIHEEDLVNPRILFYNVPTLSDISSTAVRKSTDVRLLREALEPQVLDYICEHRLYAVGRYANGRRLGGWSGGSSSSLGEGGGGKRGGEPLGGPRRRVRWLVLTGLFVTVGFLLAWRRWGIKGMEGGMRAFLRAAKGLLRIEKAA